MIAEMTQPAFSDYIKKLSSREYGIDFDKKKTFDDVPSESFRKLNVD
jgi:hypothetical protein